MSNSHNVVLSDPRYEFRIWGSYPEVGRRLSAWADSETSQEVEDCYLLLGGYSYNAKIRRRKLKIKRLLELRHGFERWSAQRHRLASSVEELGDLGQIESATGQPLSGLPAPAEQLMRGGWDGDAVLVTKKRQRFVLGEMKAEVTEMRLAGQSAPLQSVAIEGFDLPDLIDLRRSLAIADLPNHGVHLAVESRYRQILAS